MTLRTTHLWYLLQSKIRKHMIGWDPTMLGSLYYSMRLRIEVVSNVILCHWQGFSDG